VHVATLVASVLAFGSFAVPAGAQTGPCLLDQPVEGYSSGATSTLVDGATEPDSTTVTLCARGPGLNDDVDHVRFLTQAAEGDFVVEASLVTIEEGASGGVVVFAPGRLKLMAPRAAVVVDAVAGQPLRARASLRMTEGALAFEGPAALDVTLPLTLRIRRDNGVLTFATVDGDTETLLLTQDVASTPLALDVHAGLALGSGDETTHRRGTFRQLLVDVSKLPPSGACVDAMSLVTGETATIIGRNLDVVSTLFIDGDPVAITSQEPTRLTFVVPPIAAGHAPRFSLGGLGVQMDSIATVGSAGVSFVRGDTTGDGTIDRDDWREACYAVHRGKPLECQTRADVDDDGDVDDDDLSRLRAFIEGDTTQAPAGPFPNPGFAPGGIACGATPQPTGLRLEDVTGAPLDDTPRTAGDVIVLRGYGLPTTERAVVRLGLVSTSVSSGSAVGLDADESRLALRIGRVPVSGRACLQLFDAEPTGPDRARIGEAFLVDDTSTLCVDLAASETGAFTSTQTGDVITLPFSRDLFVPGITVDVEAALLLPAVQKYSRGSRVARRTVHLPVSYEVALSTLARELTLALQDHANPDCGCEFIITPDFDAQNMQIAPCVTTPEPPPPPPGPVVPTPHDVKKPTKLIGGIAILPKDLTDPTDCDVTHDPAVDPRAWAWCELETITTTVTDHEFEPYNGLPLFESFRPLRSALGIDPWVVAPNDQTVAMKHITVDESAEDHLHSGNYDDACAIALRDTDCFAFQSIWMPRVNTGDRVVKTFYVPLHALPASLDEETLYSYVAPGGERQYLVGIHIAVGRIDAFGTSEGYFRWVTAWVPAPPGETMAKGGLPLASFYSPHCTVGSALDRPDSMVGPWSKFTMCTDSDADESACGNPWAPGECPANGSTSCTSCHASTGRLTTPPGTWGSGVFMEFGWIPSAASAMRPRVIECLERPEDEVRDEMAWWLNPKNDVLTTTPDKCFMSDPNVLDPFVDE
jgi:hypothetical protein